MAIAHKSRREFLKSLGALAGTSLLTGQSTLPSPQSSGIEHIVVLMMENRSFDHFLGWLPGADGKQAGLTYFDKNNLPHPTYHLTDFQGCGHPIPDNTSPAGLVEFANGACTGWLQAGANDNFVIGYYTGNDLPFMGQAAPQWTTCDRYFSAILSETFPNRMYQHTAQTDRLDNSYTLSTLPTIWDELAAANVTGRYYYSDVPFLSLWGSKYIPISRPVFTFFADCATGALPGVSFVDPRFLGEDQGLANSDHPHSDVRNGEVFINQIYNAVTRSPAWKNTVLVINFDEWGGFFDHVTPPPAPDANPAHTQRGPVAHNIYDHTSVLKMIEWRWNLPALTARDSAANNLAEVLNFSQPVAAAPAYRVPGGPFGQFCSPFSPASFLASEWAGLAQLAFSYGWRW